MCVQTQVELFFVLFITIVIVLLFYFYYYHYYIKAILKWLTILSNLGLENLFLKLHTIIIIKCMLYTWLHSIITTTKQERFTILVFCILGFWFSVFFRDYTKIDRWYYQKLFTYLKNMTESLPHMFFSSVK